MHNKFLPSLIVAAFLLSNCKHAMVSKEQKSPVETANELSKIPEEFAKLTDEEKRLPENGTKGMAVAAGLEVGLFASEPMITNPTNISVDSKGRVWVCEAYNYDVSPEQADKKGDRIVVLEDTDGDGKADKRTVFYQGTDINTPLGIMALGDKVYVTRSPNIFVFTDADGDLVPEKKEVLFTNLGNPGDHSAHAMLPGPDGKIYFAMGNYSGEMQYANGKQVIDRAGFPVAQQGKPYMNGMVFRCKPDGSEFEVMGHNFRNNYEPAVDSYGNIFQSDNDDDGFKATRMNYLLAYGSYGYADEMTKASWNTPRINLEENIPDRHWHQNDPGSIPNMLITGPGSPAGLLVYEGDVLPRNYKGASVHAEPFYNEVRVYIPDQKGAGYTATVNTLLKSADQWFRPVDVATAPDGSVFVADWYDPVLGGGAAGDAIKGRIYRVASRANSYKFTNANLNTVEGAAEALKSPNPETRFIAGKVLTEAGEKAEKPLLSLWNSADALHRARALWVLTALPNKKSKYLRLGLSDPDPDIRIAAVRAVLQQTEDVVPHLKRVATDPEISVRREAAISLRYTHTPSGAALWTQLAQQHDGTDRWYLEALGIGADLHADLYHNFWQNKVKVDYANKAHQDIIWRSRSKSALPQLATLIKNAPSTKETLRYFRAFDFHKDDAKQNTLASLLDVQGANSKEIVVLALQQMDGAKVTMTANLRQALETALAQTRGTQTFVNLVDKFNLKEKADDLLSLAMTHGSEDLGVNASALLLKMNETKLLQDALKNQKDPQTLMLLQSLKGRGSSESLALIKPVILDKKRTLEVKQAAVKALGYSWVGEEWLLDLVKAPTFPDELKPVAGSVLFNVYRSAIQREAAKYIPKPEAQGSSLPPIKELAAYNGDIVQGEAVFTRSCTACHQVNNKGIKFGPELSQVGSKLSREGLYQAILFPDEGISHGYEGFLVTLKNGDQNMGIIKSETDAGIELVQMGGVSAKFAASQVKSREKYPRSLMPALASTMTQQELVSLVTYLETLK